jgi:hypothetical protein
MNDTTQPEPPRCPCCGGTALDFSGIVPKCLACGAGADIEGCCGE